MDYEKLNALAQSEITQDSGITRGIRDYIFWVRNKIWLVVLITIVGAVLGIFVNSKSPDIYQATASIEVERVERGDSLEDGNNNFRTEAFLGGDAIINTVTQKLLVPEILQSVVESKKLHEREDILRMSFIKNLTKSEDTIKWEPKQIVNRNIDHQFTLCAREEKDAFIINYLKGKGSERGLIFCRTRAGAIRMGEELEKVGLSVGVIQGDLSQKDRDKVMRGFKKERIQFLIATDVAARGIDFEGLAFVIQHQLPDAIQYYTHRSGRTARAGKKGVSLTLIEASERGQITKLEQSLGLKFTLAE